MEPPEISSEAGFLHLFEAGGLRCLIGNEIPSAMMVAGEIRRLPFAAPWFEGLASFRGDILPVFDLNRFLRPGDPAGRGRFLLVVGEKGERAAIRADQISTFPLAEAQELAEPAAEELEPLGRERVSKVFLLQGKRHLLLDMERLLEGLRATAAPA